MHSRKRKSRKRPENQNKHSFIARPDRIFKSYAQLIEPLIKGKKHANVQYALCQR